MSKIRVYHFHNGAGGGVLSVIRNLLKFSNNPALENHVIYTINKEEKPVYPINNLEGAFSEQVFYYSPNWNFYYTCRQLEKLLPDDKAVIVSHDWLELGMVSNLGLQNPVIQILHGDFDYYYELAQKHFLAIDSFVCISPKIFKQLKSFLPHKEDNIYYLRFPVPDIKPVSRKQETELRLVYYVRDLNEERKQFSVIAEIATHLSEYGKDYFFTIAGSGKTKEEFYKSWPESMKKQVDFIGEKSNHDMIKILADQDLFLLPSTLEGFPVALVEAMKAGVVPLITNWDKAVEELVVDGETGFYFNIGAAADYAACINQLNCNRTLLDKLSDNCVKRANEMFEPISNTKRIEAVFQNAISLQGKRKMPKKIYGSRLDQSWLPNIFTWSIRGIK